MKLGATSRGESKNNINMTTVRKCKVGTRSAPLNAKSSNVLQVEKLFVNYETSFVYCKTMRQQR
jgi:hypothetical protein